MTLKNNRAPLICHFKLCALFQSHWWIEMELKSGNAQFGSKSTFFVQCGLEIWRTILKNNRVHLLYCFKLFTSFHSHQWSQTGVTVRKHPIWVKINDLYSRVSLKFDRWPWKSIGHLSWVTSNFVYHSIIIFELTLELQSGNAKFGSKSTIFFVSRDLEIWQITLKNNRTPLLCYFRLCASFQSYWWIQTGVTVRKLHI